jgi:hypothetical protein
MHTTLKVLFLGICLGFCHWGHAQKSAKKKVNFVSLCGKVTELKGNHMPDPDAPQTTHETAGTGVQRMVYFFAPASTGTGATGTGFFKKVDAIFIKKVKTDTQGNYCIRLPKGSYSVFTKEAEGFYANKTDGEGILNPVLITTAKPANFDLVISHQASF